MKISKNTVDIFKNFATINSNILIKEGSTLATISTSKNIFAKAKIAETFPKEFAVYDLNSLLSLLTIMDDMDLTFGAESLKVTKDSREFEYYYADIGIIVAAPDKNIEVEDFYSFKLSADSLSMILKAAAVVSAPTLSVISSGGKVVLTVGDPANKKSNSFKQDIGKFDQEFSTHLSIELLKVIPGDYKVVISKKKMMYFENEKVDVKYWIALQKAEF
jgi:hypothetical protein